MATMKGRRTPKKNQSAAPQGSAWEEATGRGGMNARTVNEAVGCVGSTIVTHRTQVPDPSVSYAMGKVARSAGRDY